MVLGEVTGDLGVTAKHAILQFAGSGPRLELPVQDPELRQRLTELAEGIYPHFASK